MTVNPVARSGAPLGLASPILFGASTPVAKLLLGDGLSPWLLAGLLYLDRALASSSFMWSPSSLAVVQGKHLFGVPTCHGLDSLFSLVAWSARHR